MKNAEDGPFRPAVMNVGTGNHPWRFNCSLSSYKVLCVRTTAPVGEAGCVLDTTKSECTCPATIYLEKNKGGFKMSKSQTKSD